MLKVGLIFGGRGPEHEASLMGARAFIDNFDQSKFELSLYGIGKDGTWVTGPNALAELVDKANHSMLGTWIFNLVSHASMVRNEHHPSYPPASVFRDLDCIFPLVDGMGAEDGSLQGFLSFVDKPYVGCGILSAAQSYDKRIAKMLVSQAGIPVVKDLFVRSDTDMGKLAEDIQNHFGHWDLISKPNNAGSGLGIARISDAASLKKAFHEAACFDHGVIVEEYVHDHIELMVGVMGSQPDITMGEPAVFCPLNTSPMTYRDKYLSGEFTLKPARDFVSTEIVDEARKLAGRVYEAMGCDGYARVDFFYSKGKDKIIFNELNTAPAISPGCGFSLGMRLVGYTYGDLLAKLVSSAIDRHEKNNTLNQNWLQFTKGGLINDRI